MGFPSHSRETNLPIARALFAGQMVGLIKKALERLGKFVIEYDRAYRSAHI